MPLAWFRPDPRAPLIPVWRVAVFFVLLGGALCAWFFGHIDEDPIWSLLLGLLSVAGGMLWMVYSALKVLGDERCVILFKEGVVLRDRAAYRVQLSWSNLARGEVIEGDEGRVTLALYSRQSSGNALPSAVVEMSYMPIKADDLRGLLLECARRDALGVPLKLTALLEELKVQAGLPTS